MQECRPQWNTTINASSESFFVRVTMRHRALIAVSLLCVAQYASADSCSDICDDFPLACSLRDGSYCKGTFCHELFWQSDARDELCDNRDKTCQKTFPVRCDEASVLLRALSQGISTTTEAVTTEAVTTEVTTEAVTTGAATTEEVTTEAVTTESVTTQAVTTTEETTTAAVSSGPGSRGIMNLGETCYVNSVVQALLHAPGVRDMLLAVPDNDILLPACRVLQAMKQLAVAQWTDASDAPLDSSDLFEALHAYGGDLQGDQEIFVVGQANDANMAMGILLNALSEGFEVLTGHPAGLANRLRTNRSCRLCGERRVQYSVEPLHLVNIEGADALEDLLRLHFNPSDIQVRCDNCGGNTDHATIVAFDGAPETVVIVLNRYVLGSTVRNPHSVEIPQVINLTAGDYELVSVVRYDGGHYAADVRVGAQWIDADDSRVRPIAAPLTSGPDPYIVVYHRRT